MRLIKASLGWWLLGCSQMVLAVQAGERVKHPLGQYDSEQFATVTAPCVHCEGLPQAQWHFKGEAIAVPQAGQPVTSFSADKRGADDVTSLDVNALPGVVWTGSTQQWVNTHLLAGGKQLQLADGTQTQFEIVPKIPTNLSYWNQDTQAFFAQRALSIRGEQVGQTIVARTIWPEDFRLDLQTPPQPLQANESLKQLVQFEQGGAHSPHWQAKPY